MPGKRRSSSDESLQVDDNLLKSLRQKKAYQEMEANIREVVIAQKLIPQVKIFKLRDKLAEIDDESQKEHYINELRYELTKTIIQLVPETNNLSMDERVFMMLMVEDIAGRLVGEYLKSPAGA